ncbi:40-kDa huntingtin-associated protein-like [Uranotaenia lowii]|uniref:40-kDa huntingtin-associated protein-like n=1 Tax=Uranotaenia lowii TaxID=190385 RepID=UPI002478DA75|nr:40-kDa huntingtin-associated protein-like [Uranotaenia lowii]XP_055599974.1 40-kDa huntingtin-associated protein-like [Uranotaenia lowii]
MTSQFHKDLIQQYKTTCNKLKKIQRVLFKQFAPNVTEVADEFGSLASSFNSSFLPEYAALCYMGQAKCEKLIGNEATEVDALLRAARTFRVAHEKQTRIGGNNISGDNLEGAFRCYTQALSRLQEDSVIKAAIIRELREVNPNVEITSNFVSPCHRIWDLEQSAEESIRSKDYVAAFEKLTEIYDDVTERRCEDLYEQVLRRVEISRLLLLCLLQLPPSVRYDHKFIERYSAIDGVSGQSQPQDSGNLSEELFFLLQSLVVSCQAKDIESLISVRDQLCHSAELGDSQQVLLKELVTKYSK